MFRFDQQHRRQRQTSRTRDRSRRLRVECCEDRCLLSGTTFLLAADSLAGESASFEPLSVAVPTAPPSSEGGFIVVNTSGFSRVASNDFVLGDFAFGDFSTSFGISDLAFDRSFADVVTLEAGVPLASPSLQLDVDGTNVGIPTNTDATLSHDQLIDVPPPNGPHGSLANQAIVPPKIAASISFDTPRSTADYDVHATFQSPQFEVDLEFDLPTEQNVTPPIAKPSVAQPLVDESPTPVVVDPIESTPQDSPVPSGNPEPSGNPGLPGNTAKLLEFKEPVIVVATSHDDDSHSQAGKQFNDQTHDEGGSLSVGMAVASTQRAYVDQLSAMVAQNLDRDGRMPEVAQARLRPVHAELARTVAFDSLGNSNLSVSAASEVSSEASNPSTPRIAPVSIEPGVPVGIEAASHGSPRLNSSNEIQVAADQRQPANDVEPSSSERFAAQRIESKHDLATEAAFARWPLLAAVVASYLYTERRPQANESAVQTPPRRQKSGSEH